MSWMGHIFKHDFTEGKSDYRCYMIWQKGDGYANLKWAAEERKWWKYNSMMSEACSTAEESL